VLTREERGAIEVGLLTAAGGIARLERLFQEMLDNHDDLEPTREAILTIMYIAGAPRAINALMALSRVCEARGVPYPEFPQDTRPGGPADQRVTGEANMRRVYGPTYEAFANKMAALDGELWSWFLGDAYGKCIGRPGIELRVRMLCVVGALSTSGLPLQLVTHVNGALNVGATPEDIEETIALAEGNGYPVSEAREVWARVKAKRCLAPEA
jgi:4-carboxymuconolactone decarboxylase